MRLLVLVLAVLGLAGPLHAQDARSGPAATLERIVADIREARQLAKSSPSAGTREQFDLLLARAELAARELQRSLPRQAAAPPLVAPMSAEDHTRIVAAIAAANFDEPRLAILKTLGGVRMTAAQGKQIVQKFSFDKGKEDAATMIYPLLVDPHLFFQVLEALTFQQSRANVMKRVAR